MDTTTLDLGLLVMRLGGGRPFALNGLQKLFGWFDGGGFRRTSGWFASLGFGDGRVETPLAGTGEIVPGLWLATGLLTPLAAAAVAGTMTTAAFVNNAENGYWSVAKGWELNGYLVVVAAALAVAGPGALSLDTLLDVPGLLGVGLDGVLGAVAVTVGVLGGWLRWVTRTVPAP